MNLTLKGCLLTATAPPTDRRLSDFLEGAKFAVCPTVAEQWTFNIKKKGMTYIEGFCRGIGEPPFEIVDYCGVVV
ncbi:hypothetical protein, partial [Parabacteroides distasonis]|uniref:hypothetical protein n=1 Tax=Parabacteroides distasonis TaxID=823 RepID=UPI001F1E0F6E